ncbi:MAG: phosphotransferase [Jatrophihabitantaceae bacterium]
MTGQPMLAASTVSSGGTGDRATAALDAALDRCASIAPRPRRFESLPGGLTNRIFKVTGSSGPPVVARLSSGKSSLLAIDRHAECQNARRAADAGVSPQVLACEPENGVAVIEWIDGRTFEAADLDDSAQLARVAATCARLHAGPRFVNDFDMFTIQRGYLAIVQDRRFRLPPRYLDFMPQVERIRVALGHAPTVPCHNDLLAANILDDGRHVWFIDYEYAGNNDPCFELGNIWSEANLPADRLEELVTAYFGHRSPAKTARARLLALMSKYGWTLWASIQDGVSDVDFDFWSWGMEKYERAVAEFDGPQLSQLMHDAQQPDQPRGSTP